MEERAGERRCLGALLLSRDEGEGLREITIYFEGGVNSTALQWVFLTFGIYLAIPWEGRIKIAPGTLCERASQ